MHVREGQTRRLLRRETCDAGAEEEPRDMYRLNWEMYLEWLGEMPIAEEYCVSDLGRCEDVLSPFDEILQKNVTSLFEEYLESRAIEKITSVFLQTNTPEVTRRCLSIITNYAYYFPRDVGVFCNDSFFEKLRGMVDVASETRRCARYALVNLADSFLYFKLREFKEWMGILADFEDEPVLHTWLAHVIAKHGPQDGDQIAVLMEIFTAIFQKKRSSEMSEDDEMSMETDATIGLRYLFNSMNQDSLQYYAGTYVNKQVVEGLSSQLVAVDPRPVLGVFQRLLSLPAFDSEWILSEHNWQTLKIQLNSSDSDLHEAILDFLSLVVEDFDITDDELIRIILSLAQEGVYKTKIKATKILCIILTRSPNTGEELEMNAYPMIVDAIQSNDTVALPEIMTAVRDLMAKDEKFVTFIWDDPIAVESLHQITHDAAFAQQEGLEDVMRSIDIIMSNYKKTHT